MKAAANLLMARIAPAAHSASHTLRNGLRKQSHVYDASRDEVQTVKSTNKRRSQVDHKTPAEGHEYRFVAIYH